MIRSVLATHLTLRFLPEDWPRLRHHPELAPALRHLRPKNRIWTFYDTRAGDLSAAGWALCTGRNGRQSLQKLEPVLRSALPHVPAYGWIWSRKGLKPDLTLLEGTPAAEWSAIADVIPVYRATFRELQGQCPFEGSDIQVTLSRGSVQAGEQAETVCLLNLSLKDGSVSSLYDMASTLTDLPIWISSETVPMQGIRLAHARNPVPASAKTSLAEGSVTVGDGWNSAILPALTAYLAHQARAERGSMEDVHQARVAIRRLRSALKFFRPLLPKNAFLQEALTFQQLGHVLGDVRDWDVFLNEILPHAEANASHALLQFAESRRAEARAVLSQRLSDPSVTAAILSLGAATVRPAMAFGPELSSVPLLKHAPALLDHMAAKVHHRDAHLSRLSDQQLHELRKALKGLRYSTDIVSALYPADAQTEYMGHCKDLQDLFGRFNDSATAKRLVKQAREEGNVDRKEIDSVLHAAHRAKKKALEKLPKKWKSFSKTAPFWCQ